MPAPPHNPDDPATETPGEASLLAGAEGRRFAVIGYGNQGRAHARNLRDSGLDVVVGARPGGRGEAAARGDGFSPRPAADAAADADLVILGLPDEAAADILRSSVIPALRPGATLGFMHGFAIRFGLVDPPEGTGIVMVAPKGPGDAVRARFERGEGLPALLAVERESASGDARSLAAAWAAGIGAARAAIIETTFAHETETDLFGEQAVLCGGLLALVRTSYRILVEAGYPEGLAYMECVQEVKQVADLLYERGLASMMDRISNTAEFGAHVAADALEANGQLEASMRSLLESVRDGAFAERFVRDHAEGFPWFQSKRAEIESGPLEDAGRAVRAWMPWLDSERA